MKKIFPVIFVFLLLSGCKTDYANLPAFSANQQMQAVVEMPAGSAHLIKFDAYTHEFPKEEQISNSETIDFLPFPVNYGFIPSTSINKNPDGTDVPLPVGIISNQMPSGTTLEIMPLGVILLETDGELHYQLIAVPAKPSERSVQAETFAEFSGKYPAAKRIVELWFQHYKTGLKTKLMGWKDEKFAEDLVRRKMK